MEPHLNKVGVIGAGNFGTTIATILAGNVPQVLLYTRRHEVAMEINKTHRHLGRSIPENVSATTDIPSFCSQCHLVFPVLPSASFREAIQHFADFLRPYHVLIHGTKGFDLLDLDARPPRQKIRQGDIRTMSQVVQEETQVVRIGAISGPNLSAEIRKGLPTATVVASDFDEVISLGANVLSSKNFKIYGSHDLLGTEYAGALKNMIAIGNGIIHGLKLGKNIEALFLTRGLREMIIIGKALGAEARTFFGTAGLGDLIATATSEDSRNFNFGWQLAKGKSREEIEAGSGDLVEGVRTIKLMHHLAHSHSLDVPIVEMLFAVIFKQLPISRAMDYLLDYPYSIDVDYLDF